MMEELADQKRHRFGRSSETMEDYGQLSFVETENGIAFFKAAFQAMLNHCNFNPLSPRGERQLSEDERSAFV